jgi:hypothetical protein
MPSPEKVVERYIAMWNEPHETRRRDLVAQTVTDDATYVDPVMTGEGVDGITAMIGAAQQQFPGLQFRLASGPDAHHDRLRFTWSLGDNGGDPVAVGVDFAVLAGDGRMHEITGFLVPVE